MKFVCTQENLSRGMGQVAPLAGRNTQLPILHHTLVRVESGVLELVTTDLEVGVRATIAGKVESEGAVTVPARPVFEFIQQLPQTHPISVELAGKRLAVATEGFTAHFPTGNPDDFPLLPEPSRDTPISLPAQALGEAIERTVFAAAREETRPEIHSVYVQSSGGQIQLAATDSFRLAEATLAIAEIEAPFSFLLPLAAAQEFIRLFRGDHSITLFRHENYLLFRGETAELTSRLIDGKYPDYRQVLPQTHHTEVVVDRLELLRALKMLTVFLSREHRRVECVVDPAHQRIEVAVPATDSGEGRIQISGEIDGKPITMLFNVQYLIDGLQHLSGEQCTLFLASENEPALLRPHGTGEGYVYVVMPIQA